MNPLAGLPAVSLWLALAAAQPGDYFEIQVVDQETGRGVPLVELRTVHATRHYTDSAGRVAFHEPGLMNQKVFFHVSSHGYEFPSDGFGFRGRQLQVTPGGRATLEIRRVNLAERLYRVTGGGIYRDTLLLGLDPPLRQPVLNGLVLGSDSVVNAIYRDRIYWFWGDTNRPSYPLGNFHVPGATSELPPAGGPAPDSAGEPAPNTSTGLAPDVGVDLTYFTGPDGFARPTAQLPGAGPTWIQGLVVLTSPDGSERMFASYAKIKPPLEVYERGIVEFDDRSASFQPRRKLELNAPWYPTGHPLRHQAPEQDEYIYFPQPFPLVRVRATADDLLEPARYESYSPWASGDVQGQGPLERDEQGRPRFGWKTNTRPWDQQAERRLLKEGQVRPDELLLDVRDAQSGKQVLIHGGSVNWNAYRQRWILIAVELYGSSSLLGEVWYAESEQLTGPWRTAHKIVTHDKYSFYNPKQHPMFDQQGGRIIYFEGTYTHTFSGNPDQTPRYDYNQLMYRLDLDRIQQRAVEPNE